MCKMNRKRKTQTSSPSKAHYQKKIREKTSNKHIHLDLIWLILLVTGRKKCKYENSEF